MQGMELLAAETWVVSQLQGDTALQGLMTAAGSDVSNLYADTLPGDIAFPYLFMTPQANADVMVVEGYRVLNVSTLIVKGVDRADGFGTLKPIMSRVDELLHRSSSIAGVSPADGLVFQVQRLSTIQYPEVREGVSYRHLGGRYRFWIQGT